MGSPVIRARKRGRLIHCRNDVIAFLIQFRRRRFLITTLNSFYTGARTKEKQARHAAIGRWGRLCEATRRLHAQPTRLPETTNKAPKAKRCNRRSAKDYNKVGTRTQLEACPVALQTPKGRFHSRNILASKKENTYIHTTPRIEIHPPTAVHITFSDFRLLDFLCWLDSHPIPKK